MTVPSIGTLLDLTGQHALVTGGARGIGRAIVERLLEAGARVTVVDTAPSTVDDARWHRADVRDTAAASSIVDGVDGLTILVNNAGAYPLIAWDDLDADGWRDAIDINLTSVATYSRLAANSMRSSGTGGTIVNLSSVAGIRPVPLMIQYGVAKAAVRHLTKALAAEYGPAGIRVNTVTPGGIPTEGAAAAREQAFAPASRLPEAYRAPHRPLGDAGTPDDIARAVLFLASPMSRYITGAELVVDGGLLVT